jgi:hypothetical protein
MIILMFNKVSIEDYRATIQSDGVVHELSLIVRNETDIRSFHVANATRALMQLVHNSGYSRPFSYFFWRFYDGRKLSFPIDLSPGSQEWAEAERA